MELSKEMENKMTEKTFVELQDEVIAKIKAEHPTYDLGLVHAVFLGKLLAYTDKATLLKILN
jgi:hypothetical protein